MPDATPSAPQAPAAADTPTNQPAEGVTPPTEQSTAATTTDPAPSPDPKPLSYEEAGKLLDGTAEEAAKKRTRDPLADPEDASPLDEPQPADPLEAGNLDEILPDEPAATDEEPTPASEEPAPAEPAPAAEVPPTTPTDDNGELPKRIRLELDKLTPHDAAVVLHARRTGKSFKEAEAELFGTTEPATPVEPETTPAAEAESLEQIKAEIDELKATRRKAAEEFDNKSQVEITEKIEAAQERFVEAKARQTAAYVKYQSDYEASLGRAEEAFPDAFTPGTDLHDAVLADKLRLQKVNPAFFNDPEWAETLVFKHAGKLGKTKAEAKAAAPAPAAAPASAAPAPKAKVTTPVKPARPVPGPAPGGRAGQESQQSEQAIRERLQAAVAKGDGPAVDKIMLELDQRQKAA